MRWIDYRDRSLGIQPKTSNLLIGSIVGVIYTMTAHAIAGVCALLMAMSGEPFLITG